MLNFNADFQFFVTTKMSAPHYSPEICVKVTMLNFMVTPEGLHEQMLTIVVRNEAQKKWDQYSNGLIKKAENDKKLIELQDKILNQIANSSDDILEDTELKNTLDSSQKQMEEINKVLKDVKQLSN